MNIHKQNRELAIYMGWIFPDRADRGPIDPDGVEGNVPPTYTASLDNMLPVIASFSVEGLKVYVKLLEGIIWRDDPFTNKGILLATAQQQAEAALRVITAWEE